MVQLPEMVFLILLERYCGKVLTVSNLFTTQTTNYTEERGTASKKASRVFERTCKAQGIQEEARLSHPHLIEFLSAVHDVADYSASFSSRFYEVCIPVF